MAIMISIPAGITANQESTLGLTENLGNTITQTQATINKTLTQIECSLTPSMEGFGFAPPDLGGSGSTFPGGSGFTPGQFGNGTGAPGAFGGGPFSRRGTTPMNESLYTDLSSIDGVATMAPTLQVSEGTNQTMEMMGRSFNRLVPDYIIEGVSLTPELVDSYPILPTNITAGRNLQAGDSEVVLLSENNTAFFDAEVGDTIEILDETFEVIGVYASSGVEDIQTMYLNLSDAQSLTNNTGYITSITVFTDNSDVVTQVSNAINALHPELSVTTSQDRLEQLENLKDNYENTLATAETTLAQTQSVAFQEIMVAVAATSLIVLFVMLYTVRERTKEIGTLKAIGFSNWNVMSQFMLEGVLLSMIAGVVGITIGSVAAPALSGLLLPTVSQGGLFGRGFNPINNPSSAVSINVTPQLMLIAIGAAVLLGALGSLYPAWRASRTRPAEAMRYE